MPRRAGHYATSKAALLMFTKAAAMSSASTGCVNCVCPGLIHHGSIETAWPSGVEALERGGNPEAAR
ncbi:MAG: hypothetical protein M9905_04205 [Rhizobiaceae bacterium]|nr:hypothetical protein [Rhizobiaceae bacterium]